MINCSINSLVLRWGRLGPSSWSDRVCDGGAEPWPRGLWRTRRHAWPDSSPVPAPPPRWATLLELYFTAAALLGTAAAQHAPLPRLPNPAQPESTARAPAVPARSGAPAPGRARAGAGGGTARHRPGPAAAGSRQIRVSWRGLTCEPARAAGPSRGAAPARPAALPLPLPPPPPRSPPRRRPENGERGRRGGAGEGAGWRRPRVCADIPARPSVRRARRGPGSGGGAPAGLRGNFKPVEVQKRPRRRALRPGAREGKHRESWRRSARY